MKNKIEEVFPQVKVNSCLSTTIEKNFWIYDCEASKKSYITDESHVDRQFEVLNTDELQITLLSIDSCAYEDNNDVKKCDCAIFSDTVFCFIELKPDTSSQRGKHRKKAKEQLKTTIQRFRDNIDFNIRIEAYICLGTSTRPSTSSTIGDWKLEFEMDLDTMLHEGCKKEF